VTGDRHTCVLCGGRDSEFVVTGYDRMQAREQDYRCVRCTGCGLLSLDPTPTPAEVAGLYPPDYQTRIAGPPRNFEKPINRLAVRYLYGVGSVGRSRWLRALFRGLSGRILAGIRERHGANRLLDVGCGSGQLLAAYRTLGWQVCGIEMSAEGCAVCAEKRLEVHHGTIFDAPFAAQRFDVILLSHVIEHMLDPVAVLTRAAAFLAPRGMIVVTTPNVRGVGFLVFGSCWFGLDPPRHVFLFDPHTIVLLAQRAGLTPMRVVTAASPRILCESRHYARTQGRQLPTALAHRQALLRESARRWKPYKIYRDVMSPLTLVLALCGRGDILEAELRAV
jgi:SAM-dependent methyltransferase